MLGQAPSRRHGGRKARGCGETCQPRRHPAGPTTLAGDRKSSAPFNVTLPGWDLTQTDASATNLCAERAAWCLGRRQAAAMGGRKARGCGETCQPRRHPAGATLVMDACEASMPTTTYSPANITLCAERAVGCLGRRQAAAMGGRKARGCRIHPAASSPFNWPCASFG